MPIYLDPERERLVAMLTEAGYKESSVSSHKFRDREMSKGGVRLEVGMIHQSAVFIYLMDEDGSDLMECECTGMTASMLNSVAQIFEAKDKQND